MSQDNQYAAFISYRHLSPDQFVAKKLQSLLENYQRPKGDWETPDDKIGKVFLDKSELPTCRDLGQSLRNALLSSEYLIVVLSEKTKESKYCMEEIRFFKEAHGGKLDHILPVLVSGEPSESLPDSLLYEEESRQKSDGTWVTTRTEVEPLCCDVRAETNVKRRKVLRTEYLRLAAPLLGCAFDDLYQRHKRRQRRVMAISTGIIMAVMSVLLATLIIANIRVTSSEQRYRTNLMNSYVDTGNERASEGRNQEALAYYVKVLSEMPENARAKRGALILLQRFDWIFEDTTSDSLSIPEETVTANESTTFYLSENTNRLSYSGGATPEYSILRSGNTITLSWDTGEEWCFDLPTKSSSAIESIGDFFDKFSIAVRRKQSDDCIAITYKGCLFAFKYDGPKELHNTKLFSLSYQIDIAEYLNKKYSGNKNIVTSPNFWLSQDSDVIAVSNTFYFLLTDLEKNEIIGSELDLKSEVEDMIFSHDFKTYALTRGKLSHTYYKDGTQIEVGNSSEDCEGNERSSKEGGNNYVGISFSADNSRLLWTQNDALIVLRSNHISKEASKTPLSQRIEAAGVSDNGRIIASDTLNNLKSYRDVCFESTADYKLEDKTEPATQFRLSEDATAVEMIDAHGNVVAQALLHDGSKRHTSILYDETTKTIYDVRHPSMEKKNAYIATYSVSDSGNAIEPRNHIALDYADSMSVSTYPGGIVVTINEDYVQVFRASDQTPYRTIMPVNEDNSASISKAIVSDDGNFLVIGYVFSSFVELWDIKSNQCIAAYTPSCSFNSIGLSNNGLLYFYSNNQVNGTLIVDAPNPNKTALEALQNLCCYSVTDDNTLLLKTTSFDGSLGNWQNLFNTEYPFERKEKQVSN